jgi:hypothetical protein
MARTDGGGRTTALRAVGSASTEASTNDGGHVGQIGQVGQVGQGVMGGVSTVMDPPTEVVRLGSRTYRVREVPLARLKRFKDLWIEFFTVVNQAGEQLRDADQAAALFDLIAEKPAELLAIAIPDLDLDDFSDEVHGATIPQVFAAFDVVLRVNHLEFLKRVVPFVTDLLRAMAIRAALQAAQLTPEPTAQVAQAAQ